MNAYGIWQFICADLREDMGGECERWLGWLVESAVTGLGLLAEGEPRIYWHELTQSQIDSLAGLPSCGQWFAAEFGAERPAAGDWLAHAVVDVAPDPAVGTPKGARLS